MSATIPGLAQIKGYPSDVIEVSYLSEADKTQQPALFWKPAKSEEPIPLLVALHTWSSDYKQAGGEAVYAQWCQKMGWAFVHPNFRGKNNTPQALGSDLAVADVLSSIEFAKSQTNIDPRRIYCIGVSGGGHMSLMMAARAPEVWAGVSAWCGISDIVAWHRQCTEQSQYSRYAKHIEQALGGAPESSVEQLESAHRRSPLSWLKAAGNVSLDINHGVYDGRTGEKEDLQAGRAGSVPFSHSLHAWNEIVPETEKIPDAMITAFYKSKNSPFPFSGTDDLYAPRKPIFRKVSESNKTRITIFDGGHEIIHQAALNWLAAQRLDGPSVWDIKNPVRLKADETTRQSGK